MLGLGPAVARLEISVQAISPSGGRNRDHPHGSREAQGKSVRVSTNAGDDSSVGVPDFLGRGTIRHEKDCRLRLATGSKSTLLALFVPG
jgi:hypothetical protein